MHRALHPLLLTPFLLLPACQNMEVQESAAATPETAEEEAMAMQRYWFGMIYPGPRYHDDVDPEELATIQAGHMARIGELADSGEMALAGPFEVDPEAERPFVGLFLYDVETREEAEALAASDPAVQAGRLVVEVHAWWGVSGLTYPGDTSN
ncbi:MAG: YciI family protein [Planctomycetota bacterium]